MESDKCITCHDGGYLDHDVYCDCDIGTFYETKDNSDLQVTHSNTDNSYDDWFINEANGCIKLLLLSVLPFYDGIKVTDDTEYDDHSDYYLSSDDEDNYYANTDEEYYSYDRYLHDDGDCDMPCNYCEANDAVW